MRFDRLHIPAFGPFTNLELTFPVQGSDLHVIYGSNEAGKSSLLRAIRDLLFGIHSQSPDNFVHDYKRLRIIGEIANQAGERLTFQRRKGNKNTLLNADGNELPDSILTSFLGSVDQGYFSAMFGLGTKELRDGAEQLLRGEGDIGKALFSASMGGTPVQLVLAALTEESDRLFKGRSTANVSVRPTANAYKEFMRKSRDAIVSPEAWEKIEKDLAAVEGTKAKLEGQLSLVTRDLEWIARCEDALPTAGRLKEEMRLLEKLPLLPDVSSDFVERVRTARRAASDGSAEVQRLTSTIAKLEEQLTGCKTSPALLAEAEALDHLHQDLGIYRDRQNSLTDLATELAGLEAALRGGMQNLELTGAIAELETLRLSSAVRLACEEAATGLQAALENLEKNREKSEELRAQIETREAQLNNLPETDLTGLRDALAAAAGATDANKTLSASEFEVKRLRREVTDLHQELTGAPENVDETFNLPVPAKATIRRFGEEMDGILREMKTEESKRQEGKIRIDSLRIELGRMERRGELPSEQALRKARDRRDYGWNLVLAEWKGNGSKEAFVPDTPLEEAFPQAMVKADDIADQLRLQAEAVAQAEEKRSQILQSEQQNQEAKEKISELQGKLQQWQISWKQVWQPCGINPRTPVEMEEWREVWGECKELLRQLRVAEEALQQKSNQIRQARILLAMVLSDSEEKDYGLLFEKARMRIQQAEAAAGKREVITEQLQTLKTQLEIFHQNRALVSKGSEAAGEKWRRQCQAIGLPAGISPDTGLALLQERTAIFSKFDIWEGKFTKSQETTKAVLQYEQAVNDYCETFGIKGDTTEARVSRLWDALGESRDAQTRYNQLKEQIEETKSALKDCQAFSEQAVQALAELVHLGKVETAEALEPLLANLELRDQVQRQIATFRDNLSGLARGQTVDNFLARIQAEDIEALPQKKETLQNQKQEVEASLQTVRATLFELNSQRQALEAVGDEAAHYRQQAESCGARLRQDASRFLRLRLAAHFLQIQIERFRKENQGPLLAKSGQIFQSITRGAFSGLGAEFNADDIPILVGLRSDQSSVPVGGMSDGSRDQLYLALRLAALDRYIEQHEPMPLILDDLLITFDDDRTIAILPQLATLAQRTQIFLFTHHDHLVELCRRTLGENTFHLHRLNTDASATTT